MGEGVGWEPAGARAHIDLGGAADRSVSRAEFLWGQRFWCALVRYLAALEWPAQDAEGAGRGVAFAELAIDFETVTGVDIPGAVRPVQPAAHANKAAAVNNCATARLVFHRAVAFSFILRASFFWL